VCVSCFSAAEAVVLQAGGAVVLGAGGLRRLRGGLPFRDRQASWQRRAAFLQSLGHDPVELLGAPPEHG
jgi:hypothetical protein